MNDHEPEDPMELHPSVADLDEFTELRGEIDALPVATRGAAPDVDAAWTELRARLDAPAPGVPARPARPRATGRVAAAVALLAIGAGALWTTAPVRVSTAPGERVSVALPDGSAAELNAGSSIRHARGFAWVPGVNRPGRVVELDGEAYFDVATDGRPFTVETPVARIRVLGTRFSVRATSPRSEGVSIVVMEGRVEVSPRVGEASTSVVLGAGEAARVGPDGVALRLEGETDHLGAWRDGAFVAVDRPLEYVLADAGRIFGVDVTVEDEGARSRPVTYYLSEGVELERVLADLATLAGLQYREVAPGRWELGTPR